MSFYDEDMTPERRLPVEHDSIDLDQVTPLSQTSPDAPPSRCTLSRLEELHDRSLSGLGVVVGVEEQGVGGRSPGVLNIQPFSFHVLLK